MRRDRAPEFSPCLAEYIIRPENLRRESRPLQWKASRNVKRALVLGIISDLERKENKEDYMQRTVIENYEK